MVLRKVAQFASAILLAVLVSGCAVYDAPPPAYAYAPPPPGYYYPPPYAYAPAPAYYGPSVGLGFSFGGGHRHHRW
jgi:hypothetical protein